MDQCWLLAQPGLPVHSMHISEVSARLDLPWQCDCGKAAEEQLDDWDWHAHDWDRHWRSVSNSTGLKELGNWPFSAF